MITLKQLIKNISQGQSSASPKYILQGLNDVYDKISNRIKITKALSVNNGTQVYTVIPSETKSIFYDVVFWFQSEKRITNDTPIKVYSNSPNFGYNFVFIFYRENSLLFPEKYPRDFLSMAPRVRNPYGLYAFDKHVYASLKFLYKYDLNDLVVKTQTVEEPQVATFEDKKTERNSAG